MSGYNIRILARNLVDASGVAISATPAMVSTSLDEQNLILPTERDRVARTSSLAAQEIYVQLAAAGKANCAGFTRTNYSTAATLRTRILGAGSPTPTLLDTGALAAYSTSAIDTDIQDYTEADFQGFRNTIQYFALQSAVWAARFNIADAANADGYMQQTRLWLGKYHQFYYDPPFGGLDLEFPTGDKAGRADNGTHIVSKEWKARELRINLAFVAATDLATLLAIAQYIGTDKEVLIDVYPELGDAKSLYHLGAYRCKTPIGLNPSFPTLHKTTLTFEET